jgi:hypothetical protein
MNSKFKFLIVLSLIFMGAIMQVQAEKYKGPIVKPKNSPKDAAGCLPPSRSSELSLNMVRAYLMTNGTMWNRSSMAEYEVPKGSGKTSMFSAALWIGGLDQNGNPCVAAMTFGQRGNDYFTGPLRIKDGLTDVKTCTEYDRFYRISRIEVERHKYAFSIDDQAYINGEIPRSILEWPATSAPGSGLSPFLAPFQKGETNQHGDPNEYEPRLGDFPYYDIPNALCPWTRGNIEAAKQPPWLGPDGEPSPFGIIPNPKGLPMPPERVWTRQNPDFGWDNKMIYADHVLKGDETIFWFLNDRGNVHSESQGIPIGLEIRVQAFAFATNDELNRMTFYSYEIINRASTTLYNTFFSQWVDPDLGYAWDDYVGCDVNRGLGYCYNGEEIDGSGQSFAYGANPPAVGVDFFQGPYIDPDGSDNPRFIKKFADVQGTEEQKEYCRKFVNYIYEKWGEDGPLNLSDTIEGKTLIIEIEPDVFDTVPIRWNNQFAINGVNFGDEIVDNERFGMRRFVYHDNNSSVTGDPRVALEYYQMLQGYWRDGSRMKYGGNGWNPDSDMSADFMFPAGTDYCNWGTHGKDPGAHYGHGGKTGKWTESFEGTTPDDRRFMHSAGPFTLRQGACNYITVGIPWARTTVGGVQASIALLMVADDKCQALFENCFKLIDGPDAPNVTIREFDQKLVLLLTNPPFSNNRSENYEEEDPQIVYADEMSCGGIYSENELDVTYKFEGYQIYQVIGPEVSSEDLDNPNLARLIRQCDIINFDKDGSPIGRLINWEFDEVMQVSVPRLKVDGANMGIQHSFEITEDVFAPGDRRLVNYKTYYFVAIAYAYNEFLPFFIDENNTCGLYGQKLPYLRGRKTADGQSVVPVAAIPHPPFVHGGGLTLNSDYGSIPSITRIDGQGNGGIALELTKETIDKIVDGGDNGSYRLRELVYERNAGPLNIRVIDPLRVRPYDYTIFIREADSVMRINSADISENAYWVLRIDDEVSEKELEEIGLVDDEGRVLREIIPYNYIKVPNRRDSAVIITISQYEEYLILPLGLSIGITNKGFANTQPDVAKNWARILTQSQNNLYTAQLRYSQSEKIDITNDIIYSNNVQWITGLRDDNLPLPSNWIRAGSYKVDEAWSTTNSLTHGGGVFNKYFEVRLEDAHYPTEDLVLYSADNPDPNRAYRAFKDFTGKFGTLCNGTWAPYVLTSPYNNAPQAKYTRPEPHDNVTEPRQNYYWFYEYQWGLNPMGTADQFASRPRPQRPAVQPGYNQTMTNLYSVDIVLTPDKSKWTRCVVLEACPDPIRSEGGALKNEPRKAKSVGKDGKPDNSRDGFGANGDEGMGWFPGYAINIETGERLNIMFSENSDIILNERFGDHVRGADMIFNPTSAYAIATENIDFAGLKLKAGDPFPKELYDMLYVHEDDGAFLREVLGVERVWGGMHYVYVCNSAGNTCPIYYMNPTWRTAPSEFDKFLADARRNHNLRDMVLDLEYYQYANAVPPTVPPTYATARYGGFLPPHPNAKPGEVFPVYECGPYDEGRWLVQKFKQFVNEPEPPDFIPPTQAPYTQFPHSYRRNNKMQLFNNVMYTHIPMQPTDVTLQNRWMSGDVTYKIRVTRPYMRYVSRWFESPEERNYQTPSEVDHRGFPVYKMSTKALAPVHNDTRVYQKVLDNINIVPNPYYGGSLYERNSLDTRVKIINLPTGLKNGAPVTINIFTVNGILVRTLTKGDNETSFVDWDLKNFANIPVAGGVYIIHVNCPGIGERMLKFFCTMRPTDLNTF